MNSQLASELFIWAALLAFAVLMDLQLFRRGVRAWLARGGEAADEAEALAETAAPEPEPAAVPAQPAPPAAPADQDGRDNARQTAVASAQPAPAPAPSAPAQAAANAPAARVHISMEVPQGTTVRVTVEAARAGGPDSQPVVTVSSTEEHWGEPALPAAASLAPPQVTVAPSAAAPAQPPATAPAAVPAAASAAAPAVRPGLAAGRAAGQAVAGWWEALAAAVARLRDRLRLRALTLEGVLFGSALAVYLATRLIGLADFPIYFFTDEAVHTVLAEHFVQNGLTNLQGEFLPTYFPLGSMFGLNGASVYLQVLPYLLFGKSVFVTRATSVLVTMLAAAAVGLILRDFFKARYWWTATLLLSIAPVWFLHSRTAFENVEVAAFYAGFLYFYLRYRHGSLRSLYAAIILGALTFYTHGLGQVLMAVTGAALLVVDIRYHIDPARREVALRGLLLIVAVALPFGRFWLAHPSVLADQLVQRGSSVTESGLSTADRLRHIGSEYLFGLSPVYWFTPANGRDETRHAMAGYGNLLPVTLPFLVLGFLLALRNLLRSPAHRIVLVALLASPVGAALVEIGAPRILWFVMPAAVLTGLGLSVCLEWLERRRVPYTALAVGATVVLSGINVYMLRDALVNGPTWYSDYTLYGMQYGARQVFGQAVPEYLAADPDTLISVSPSWANGADALVDFFLDEEQRSRVDLQGLDHFLNQKLDLDPNLIVVLPAPEYEQAKDEIRFSSVDVDRVLNYPDGRPGFYFVHLHYAPNADELIAAAESALQVPAKEQIELDGQLVDLEYTQLDGGRLADLFDRDFETVSRTHDINPAVLDFRFPQPREVSSVTVTTGSMDVGLKVELYLADDPDGEPVIYSQTYTELPDDPTVELTFEQVPTLVSRLRLEILKANEGEHATVHIREIVIR